MLSSQQNKAKQSFHTESEKALFANRLASPIGPGDYFLTATRCKGCHGYDTLGMANVNAQGVDINLVDDWQTTMMANSSAKTNKAIPNNLIEDEIDDSPASLDVDE